MEESGYAKVRVVPIKFRMEECAADMEQTSNDDADALVDAPIQLKSH